MNAEFLDEFMALVDGLELSPDSPVPLVEVKPGETVLCLLPTTLRKFWVVLDALSKDYIRECEVASRLDARRQMLDTGSSDYVAFKQLHAKNHQRVTVASEYFLRRVAEICPGNVSPDDIRLRTGWQVVEIPAKKGRKRRPS